jgi:hypothetical protein
MELFESVEKFLETRRSKSRLDDLDEVMAQAEEAK